ncbi:hypothetical protein Phi47:1_gp65 [Cellulophaga phage phi47:1]|nr:hypothetical protein Phi3ST:2_gp65 [Cellulophaga phage phi3ST:2]AGO48260.1 hypothetical protein PhiSM_gp65 [Cellulophaga phage phiSM]AGO49304.1 hypothetical protein Phi38:2_gp65 [Cellulophaga phage phi38:2]AGO49384.1 hypothetical protein Phi3:1_gp65 [Cellulophaga phage phi3:1]AGO49802.1 hypothetical protein Phi47:1_gp65 [Cellulophaga phage phi47:1]
MKLIKYFKIKFYSACLIESMVKNDDSSIAFFRRKITKLHKEDNEVVVHFCSRTNLFKVKLKLRYWLISTNKTIHITKEADEAFKFAINLTDTLKNK